MDFIRQTALSLGFDACGIAKAEALPEDAQFLQEWLNMGNHAEMHYLERNFEKRTDPRLLVPGCKSVVVVLMNFFPPKQQVSSAPQVAKYAYPSIDYHQVLKSKLSELELSICEEYGSASVSTDYQHAFVDSAPILERRWAQRAGLGWIGKHTQLINPTFGSYTFIGVLLLNIELEYSIIIESHCGTCTKCIQACPTKALNNGILDARRCISYLTIESKNDIPAEFADKLSGCAFGCDICADVCPWNKKLATPHLHNELSPATKPLQWNTQAWQNLTKEQYTKAFKESALKRAGFEKLKKNISNI